ncbi:MAG: hypothetical protein AAGH89_15335 [Verrucomicrobiota bacterium]
MKLHHSSLGFLACLLASCQTQSSSTYSSNGRAGGQVVEGSVTAMNPTVLKKKSGEVGSFIGSSAGMIGGSMIGGDAAAHAAGALGGLLVGALAGNEAEKALSKKKGWDLWIEGDDGRSYVMPVRDPHPFVLNGRVKLVLNSYGQPTSVHKSS